MKINVTLVEGTGDRRELLREALRAGRLNSGLHFMINHHGDTSRDVYMTPDTDVINISVALTKLEHLDVLVALANLMVTLSHEHEITDVTLPNVSLKEWFDETVAPYMNSPIGDNYDN